MLLFCITTLNGKDRRINEKAFRRMIEHMTTIKNLLRNLNAQTTEPEEPDSTDSGEPGTTDNGEPGTTDNGEPGTTDNGEPGTTDNGEPTTTDNEEPTTTPNEPTTIPTEPTTTPTEPTTTPTEEPSSNSTEPLKANPDFTGRRRNFNINILAFNSYKGSGKSISFAVFFLFLKMTPHKTVRFFLTIRYFRIVRRFRYLTEDKNETADCSADSELIEGKNVRYTCQSSIQGNADDIEQVAIVDVDIPGVNSLKEINFSDEALFAASNLQKFTNEVQNMYDLKNGELKYSNNYFVIKDDIEDYQGEVGDEFRLQVYDNSSGIGILNNASCSLQTITNKKYQFKCTSKSDIDGYIHLGSMYNDEKKNAINLYMNEGNETLSFKGNGNNGNTPRSNPIYKKSSSGLSGGAIAGIVIACAVVLIIASIIAMMLRKSSVPIHNNSSITELKSIDNYTQ
jgi:hypothetical protein